MIALFLGMGSSPFLPSLPGIQSKNVFTFHTVADAHGILNYVKQNQVKRVIVCGAGLSGLEAADALSKHGLTITLIEKNSRVLSTLLNEESAAFCINRLLRQE